MLSRRVDRAGRDVSEPRALCARGHDAEAQAPEGSVAADLSVPTPSSARPPHRAPPRRTPSTDLSLGAAHVISSTLTDHHHHAGTAGQIALPIRAPGLPHGSTYEHPSQAVKRERRCLFTRSATTPPANR